VLYAFTGGSDGDELWASPILDKAGNLYGTTSEGGGGTNCLGSSGCGTVFELAPDGTETVLHAFQGGTDGAFPVASLLIDKDGNLYGTTEEGGSDGCNSYGCGIVFKVAPDGTETVLYAFQGGIDGAEPESGLIVDKAGDFYGTTAGGGGYGCDEGGCGTVFELTPSSAESVLYRFEGPSVDGAFPNGMIEDTSGNFFGTTEAGGNLCTKGSNLGCGTIFELTSNGTETMLYSFSSRGIFPEGVIEDEKGNLYGVTSQGGRRCPGGLHCGTVFELKR